MSHKSEIEGLLRQLRTGGISRREFVSRAAAFGLSVGTIGMGLTACGEAGNGKASRAPAADLGPIEKELNIYNWSDYIAEDTLPNFEKEFGVKVTYDNYESNEEMLAEAGDRARRRTTSSSLRVIAFRSLLADRPARAGQQEIPDATGRTSRRFSWIRRSIPATITRCHGNGEPPASPTVPTRSHHHLTAGACSTTRSTGAG